MTQPSDAGAGDTHYLVCGCGFDPWKALETSNSGPDDDNARVALMLHLREHSRMSAGGADWLIQKDTARILARHGIPLEAIEQGCPEIGPWPAQVRCRGHAK